MKSVSFPFPVCFAAEVHGSMRPLCVSRRLGGSSRETFCGATAGLSSIQSAQVYLSWTQQSRRNEAVVVALSVGVAGVKFFFLMSAISRCIWMMTGHIPHTDMLGIELGREVPQFLQLVDLFPFLLPDFPKGMLAESISHISDSLACTP